MDTANSQMGESKSEAVEEKGPSSGRGASEDGPKWQSGSNSALLTLRVGETLERHILLSPTSWGRYRLVALTPSWDLFVHAKNLFVEAKPPGGYKGRAVRMTMTSSACRQVPVFPKIFFSEVRAVS